MGLLKYFINPHRIEFRDPKTYNIINCPECDGKGWHTEPIK